MHDIATIGKLFNIAGELQSAIPYGSGHINDTYLACYQEGSSIERFVHQRINHHVFRQPIALMDNFEKVVDHIGDKLCLAGEPDGGRRVLTLVPGKNGRSYATDADGNTWRTTRFISNTVTHDIVTNSRQLFEAGRAFGHFQQQLADLPLDSVVETIPDFHNTRWRFEQLKTAVSADPCNRAQHVKDEIAFAADHEHLVDTLLDLNAAGKIPTRIIHNDTKINNLLFDTASGKALCVTDLDTVMPGLIHYDFGDLVRSAVGLAAEDEPDLSKVYADIDRFRQLAHGYLSATQTMLTPLERQYLPLAGPLITFEIGLRFLADYLQGDSYFKIHRPQHNLDRARTQFKLVASMEAQAETMREIIANY
ncbi:MAG: aminoglycoside phosphotransferase family protein [Chloroflexota bacterium]